MIAALLLAAVLVQTPGQTPAATRAGPDGALVLPGVLDLPLVEGATPMADCGRFEPLFAGVDLPRQCLTTTMAQSDAVADAYVASAKARGWLGGGGVANVMNLHRPNADGTCRRLDLAVFPGGQATGPADPAIILIGVTPSHICPTQAPAR